MYKQCFRQLVKGSHPWAPRMQNEDRRRHMNQGFLFGHKSSFVYFSSSPPALARKAGRGQWFGFRGEVNSSSTCAAWGWDQPERWTSSFSSSAHQTQRVAAHTQWCSYPEDYGSPTLLQDWRETCWCSWMLSTCLRVMWRISFSVFVHQWPSHLHSHIRNEVLNNTSGVQPLTCGWVNPPGDGGSTSCWRFFVQLNRSCVSAVALWVGVAFGWPNQRNNRCCLLFLFSTASLFMWGKERERNPGGKSSWCSARGQANCSSALPWNTAPWRSDFSWKHWCHWGAAKAREYRH